MIALLLSATASAQKGVYESLELRKREPNDLMETAEQYEDLFERRSLMYGDQDVVGLVSRIGHELAPPPTDEYIDYQFFVIRDPSPNAFAFPNGHIYVHTGMLARLQDASQLAALLAHEINHVAGHHGILSHRITAKRLAIGMVAGGLASLMGQLRYSRQLEQEADDRAPLLLLDSPYDPHALPELLAILAEDFEGIDPRISSMWTTHPEPELRVAASLAAAVNMPVRERDPAVFDAMVYPLRLTTVRDYIQDDYPLTAIALADRLIERHPDDLELQMLLGDAWQQLGPRTEVDAVELTNKEKRRNLSARMRRTREERASEMLETEEGRQALATNLDHARQTYERIVDQDPAYAPAYRGLGEVHDALRQPRDAGRAYLQYLRLNPDAPDASVITGRLLGIRNFLKQQESDNDSN